MSSDEKKINSFRELLDFADYQERFDLEFKGIMPWNDLKYKITRSVLAMSNQQDGGIIIIGIKEENNRGVLIGLSDEVLTTYKVDRINSFINKYADPMLTVKLELLVYDEKNFMIIHVSEYDYLPIICKKTYTNPENSRELILQEGTIYHRRKGENGSYNHWTVSEMREFINLATNKKQARREQNQQIINSEQNALNVLDDEVSNFE